MKMPNRWTALLSGLSLTARVRRQRTTMANWTVVASQEWVQAFLKAVDGCPPIGVLVRNFVLGCSVGSAKLKDVSELVDVHAFNSIFTNLVG
mmetsp:Transcript_104203/g.201838  ORF Transcript_104203/g.201838 Transcript_104203/m.201838 type:complete len:92 (-) Transcript_104203:23-298(-)